MYIYGENVLVVTYNQETNKINVDRLSNAERKKFKLRRIQIILEVYESIAHRSPIQEKRYQELKAKWQKEKTQ